MKAISNARWTRLQIPFALLVIGIMVMIAYAPILNASFFGDDWIFYELAGRLPLGDYLAKYFDPGQQTAWYRPVQGILWRLGYSVFSPNPMGFHLTNVLLHLANGCWLFAIVSRITRRRATGLVAALVFSTLPTAAVAVFWPGVVDPLATFFTLTTLWFWLAYLRQQRTRDYWLAFVAFLLALYCKEINAGLPFTLFLVERFVVGVKSSFKDLIRRYVWFVIAIAIYVPIEIIVVSRSVFISREGYAPSLSLLTNLLDYLATLAFPWQLPSPLNYVSLGFVVLLLAYVVFVRHQFALLPLVANAVLAILPILPFPFVNNRFLYLSVTSSAILIALMVVWIWQRISLRWAKYVFAGVIATVVCIGGASVSNAASDFAEYARVARVPFRNVSQAHPTFADDTLVYFIDPPLPGPNLSGMFFWRYGSRVVVRADDMGIPAGLRDHADAYINYFDEHGNQKEVQVEKRIAVRDVPQLPVNFAIPIRLDKYELARATIKRDQAVVLFLYWSALDRIPNDYAILVQLVDANGKVAASYEREPRQGKSPTSSWKPGQPVIDVIALSAASALPGAYQLRIALYDSGAQKSVALVDADGKPSGEYVLIAPLSIIE